MKYSVVVVDDQKLLSDALTGMIESFKNFNVLYACKNVNQLQNRFESSEKNIPDLVVLDVNCPNTDCKVVIEWLVKNYGDVKVMALFFKDNENAISQILEAGADGCLHKDIKKEVFESALLTLVNEGFYRLGVSTETKNVNTEKQINFKENELEFMKLACSELTYREIAEKMCLSPKTIDGYRDRLFTKLNVKNRVGMVLYALKHQIYVQ